MHEPESSRFVLPRTFRTKYYVHNSPMLHKNEWHVTLFYLFICSTSINNVYTVYNTMEIVSVLKRLKCSMDWLIQDTMKLHWPLEWMFQLWRRSIILLSLFGIIGSKCNIILAFIWSDHTSFKLILFACTAVGMRMCVAFASVRFIIHHRREYGANQSTKRAICSMAYG